MNFEENKPASRTDGLPVLPSEDSLHCQRSFIRCTDMINSYKVTKGLLDRFGEKRVIDSPITESGFAGLTVGAALAGLHPVVCLHYVENISCCVQSSLTFRL